MVGFSRFDEIRDSTLTLIFLRSFLAFGFPLPLLPFCFSFLFFLFLYKVCVLCLRSPLLPSTPPPLLFFSSDKILYSLNFSVPNRRRRQVLRIQVRINSTSFLKTTNADLIRKVREHTQRCRSGTQRTIHSGQRRNIIKKPNATQHQRPPPQLENIDPQSQPPKQKPCTGHRGRDMRGSWPLKCILRGQPCGQGCNSNSAFSCPLLSPRDFYGKRITPRISC
jgi:hypothetical protein